MIKTLLRLFVLALVLGGLTLGVRALTCKEKPAGEPRGEAPVASDACSA